MGYLAPLLTGWQGRSYWCVIPETNTDTRGNVICHLKEAAQEHPILRLLSHPTLGSYLSRSLQQTQDTISTALQQWMPRLPEIMCPAWMAQQLWFSKHFPSSFLHIVTVVVLTSGCFPQNESIQPVFLMGHWPPAATNSCFKFSLSFWVDFFVFLSFMSANIGWAPVMG